MRNTLLILVATMFLAGCADAVSLQAAATHEPVGFWHGLWHGVILPVAWITSVFDNSTAIYAIYNTGAAYDTGFFIGVWVLAIVLLA